MNHEPMHGRTEKVFSWEVVGWVNRVYREIKTGLAKESCISFGSERAGTRRILSLSGEQYKRDCHLSVILRSL